LISSLTIELARREIFSYAAMRASIKSVKALDQTTLHRPEERPVVDTFRYLCDHTLELLERGRNKAGVTQTTLAETVGRPQSFVAKYESGERRLDAAEFVGIARAVGADPFKLFKAIEKNKAHGSREST
jgi:ribosome-binding protein aMBF1 (putative translation factor)